jgi:triosephosphate isomerase
LLLFSNQNKKIDKEKDKGIPCVMCITNDDATRNGKKHNDVTKKKENA